MNIHFHTYSTVTFKPIPLPPFFFHIHLPTQTSHLPSSHTLYLTLLLSYLVIPFPSYTPYSAFHPLILMFILSPFPFASRPSLLSTPTLPQYLLPYLSHWSHILSSVLTSSLVGHSHTLISLVSLYPPTHTHTEFPIYLDILHSPLSPKCPSSLHFDPQRQAGLT